MHSPYAIALLAMSILFAAGSASAGAPPPTPPAPPDPTDVVAFESPTKLAVYWSSGGGETGGYYISHSLAGDPPAKCAGAAATLPGAATNFAELSIPAGEGPHHVRICSYHSASPQVSVSEGVTLTPTAISSDENMCVAQDHHEHGDAALGAYYDLFMNTPDIAEAMDYCDYHDDLGAAIWQALTDANALGYVADLPNPAGMAPDPFQVEASNLDYIYYVDLTRDELIASYAAKVAHAFLLEVQQTFQWRLGDFDEALLRQLLDPNGLYCDASTCAPEFFVPFDPASDPAATLLLVLDHSPQRTFTITDGALGAAGFSGDQVAAVTILLDDVGRTLRHSNVNDPVHAVTMDLILQDLVARVGCHSASRFMAALARSVNIPATNVKGYYGGSGHASAIFESIDGVLGHGDDLYSGDLRAALGTDVLDAYSYWAANILPLGPNNPDNWLLTRRQHTLKALTWISPATEGYFCSESLGGRQYLDNLYRPTLYALEADALLEQFFDDLEALTGCDGIDFSCTCN